MAKALGKKANPFAKKSGKTTKKGEQKTVVCPKCGATIKV